MRVNRTRVVAIIVVLAALSAASWYWLSLRGNGALEALSTSGTIEATEVPLAAEVPGKVTEVLVQEGQKVAAGAEVVRLDATSLEIQLEQTNAAVMLAEARLAEARAGARLEQVRQVEETARQAAAAFDGAKKNYDTVKQMYDKGVAPKVQMDSATTQLDTAQAQSQAARAQAELVKKGATQEQLRQLEAAVAQARATAKLAQYNLERGTVKATISGVVVRRLVEPGALVSPGANVITLENLDDLWLRVYVPENQLNLVRLSQRVKVTVDAFPNRSFVAEVVNIADGAEFTPRNVQTKQERATTVYAVKLRLLEGLKGELKPGMPADVSFPAQGTPGR
jgi:HlyD family secretion protein